MGLLLPSSQPSTGQVSSSHPRVSTLSECIEWGVKESYLRHLDMALVRFFYGLQSHLSDENLFPLLWLVALLSQYQSQGHPCISLRAVLAKEVDLFRGHQLQKNDFLRMNYASLKNHLPQSLPNWNLALSASRLVCDHVQSSEAGENNWMKADDPTPLVAANHSSLMSQASIVSLPVERDVLVYFKRQWLAEDFIANRLFEKSRVNFEWDEALVKEKLSLLFDEPSPSKGGSIDQEKELDWQKIACALSLKSSLTVITGGPGTGKTYTVARLIALAVMLNSRAKPLRVALAAPTGKAASRLYRSIESSLLSLSSRLEGHIQAQSLVAQIGAAKTLHTLLGYQAHEKRFRFNERRTLPLDLLVLDEASMVDAELMCALLRALQPQTTLILLGDKDQLSSVEVGSILGELSGQALRASPQPLGAIYDSNQVAYLSRVMDLPAEHQMSAQHPIDLPFNNSVMLQRSRRFSGHIAQLAQAINGGEQEAVGRVLTKANSQDIHCISSVKMDLLLDVCLQRTAPLTAYGQSADLFQDEVKPNFLNYLKVFQRNGALPNSPDFSASVGFEMDTESWILEALLEFERFRVLSAINEGPLGALAINASIEKRLQKEGWIRSHGEWYSGRAIMLTRNQHDLGLSNGDVGLVVGGRGEKGGQTSFRAYFLSGSGFQSVSINRLLSVQTAYAMSIHKSQGSEYEHALVVLQDQAEKALTRELLYTGVTRAKKYLSLFQTQPGLIEQAVSMRAKRTSGLARRIQQLSTQAGRTGP